jgi:hypothetical protein
VLAPYLAHATKHLGLVPTLSATEYPPFLLARLVDSLDGIVTLTSVKRPDSTCTYVVPDPQRTERMSPDARFEGLGPNCAMRICGQLVAAWMEVAMDECVSEKEVLSR